MTRHNDVPAGRTRPAALDPRTTRRSCGGGQEAGSLTVELVLLTPVVLVLLAFIVGLGRTGDARGRLTGATRDAARAASLSSTPSQAAAAATQTARADLQGAGLECRNPQVSTDTTAFSTAGPARPSGAAGAAGTAGTAGTVAVTVRCTLDLSDLVVSGLPGRTTLTVRATAPLDTYTDQRATGAPDLTVVDGARASSAEGRAVSARTRKPVL